MKTRNVLFVVAAVFIGLLYFCTDMPTDSASAESALTLVTLTSSTGAVDTVIVDSTEKDIEVMLTFEYGYFIDSVVISIFTGPDFTDGGTLDSQIVFRFGPDDLRDTTRFNLRFLTGGERRFEVVSYKRHGFLSTVTATAFILAPPEVRENTPPQFIAETPRNVYRFDEGDLVRFTVAASDINGDSLWYGFLYEKDSLPRAETAVLSEGYFEWQSAEGDKGIYPIVFTVSDGSSTTSIVTTIVIGDTSFNQAPEIVSEAPATAKVGILYDYQPIAVDDADDGFIWHLLGTHPDGLQFDSLTGRIKWIPGKGVVTSGALTLKVTDFGFPQKSDSQRIVITVSDGNRPPVAKSQSVATDDGVPVTVQLDGTDWDDSLLRFELTRLPMHGTVATGENGTITYTPETGFQGVDTLWWVVHDPVQTSDTAMVKIFVAMENQKPQAHGQQLSTGEDIALSLVLSADDVEADVLTYTLLEYPVNGTLTGSGKEWLYTPNAEFSGADTFSFFVNDGALDSDPAMVIIVVASENDTPVVHNMGLPTEENTPVSFVLSVNDPDDSLFLFELTRAPLHGSLDSSMLPSVRYTPEDGFKGIDTIGYRAVDESGLTGPSAIIIIDVGSDNQRPVTLPVAVTGKEDSSVTVTLDGSDPEGTTLQYAVVTMPKHGTLSGTGATRIYTPYKDYNGADTLLFTVSDGMLVSEAGTAVITIEAVNDLPLAQSQSVAVQLNGTVAVTLAATDVDDSQFTFTITGLPQHGRLDTSSLVQGRVFYSPDSSYKGNDTIRFTATDGAGAVSAPAMVTISVATANQRPVAEPQSVSINEDVTQTIFLSGYDLETSVANLSFSITSHPRFGQLEGNLPNISYKTAPDFNGVDTFWFAVNDGALTSNPARVVIEVLPVNDPPSAIAQTVATGLNASVPIQLQATDVDDIVFTYEIVAEPRHGTVATGNIANGNIVYTPASGYKGNDTLSYRALDASQSASAPALIIIGVALDNQPPVALSKTIVLNEDTPRDDTLSGTDLENAPLQYTVTRSPVHGRIEGDLPAYRYIPNQNFFGADSLFFIVSDGSASSAPGIIRINVQPINDPPTGNQQTVTTGFNTGGNTPLEIVLSGNDIEGGLLSFHVTEMPDSGTLDTSSIGNRRVYYVPDIYFKGIDSILFVVRDAEGAQSAPVKVTIAVAPENLPPWAVAQTVSTNEDVALPISILAYDEDGPTATYTIVTYPAHGILPGTGQNYIYTPENNFNGTDYFEFICHDGILSSNVARVDITVNAVNDPPAVSSIPAQSIIRGATFNTIRLDDYVNDPDNSDAQISWTTTANSNLTVAINSQRVATIAVSDPAWTGSETITFTATDPGSQSRSVDVVFTVRPNTPPTVSTINDIAVNEGITISPVLFSIYDAESPASVLIVTVASDNPQLLPTSAISVTGTGTGRTMQITPVDGEYGSALVTVSVSDGVSTVTEEFTLIVNGRPTADLSATPSSGAPPLTVAFSASGSDDPENGTLTYSWQFGDGTTSEEESPSHLFSTAGSYTVQLTVSDDRGFSDVATEDILVNTAPDAIASSDVTSGDAPLTVAFTGSASSDSDEDALTYVWNFGDGTGTSTLADPAYTFTAAGTYSVTLTVTDEYGATDDATVSITVSEPNGLPEAVATADVTSGHAPLTVSFNGSSSTDPDDDPLNYLWNFGTATSNEAEPEFTFDVAGTYPVSLTVDDGNGGTDVDNITITVSPPNQSPFAAAGQEDTIVSGTGSVTITLDGSGSYDTDGEIESYSWSDADGLLGTGPTYDLTLVTGTYTVVITLAVTDDDGAVGTFTKTISVNLSQPNQVPIAVVSADPLNGTASLLVNFTGSGSSDPDGDDLSYSWDFGDDIGTSTEENPDYSFNTAGSYTVTLTVSDGNGGTDAETVLITVNAPPTITDIEDQIVTVGTSTGPIGFTINDVENDEDELNVSTGIESDNPDLISSVILDGSGTDRTIEVIPASGQTGTATITITVTDLNDASVSTQFELTVN